MKHADKGKVEEKRIIKEVISEVSSWAEVINLQDGYTGAFGRSIPQPSDLILMFPIGPSMFVEIKYTEDPIAWSTNAMSKSQWQCSERCFDKNIPYFVLLFNGKDYYFIPCDYFVSSFREKKKASHKYIEIEKYKYDSVYSIFHFFTEAQKESTTLLEGL